MIFEEIFMANGTAIIMMAFLLYCRHRNRESIHADDRIYDWMTLITLLGAVIDTLTFLVDGQSFVGARCLNYLTNSLVAGFPHFYYWSNPAALAHFLDNCRTWRKKQQGNF